MRPVLGDLLAAASERIDAATSNDLQAAGAAGVVVSELARLTAVMTRCADAFVLDDHTGPAYLLGAQALALADARSALRHAAARMRTAASALRGESDHAHHPVAAHLSAATAYLAAGHDLLQSHFAPGEAGSRQGNSLWAPAIVSTPVNTALATEMGRHAGRLAHWVLQLAAAPSDKALPAPARVAITAAGRWLRTAEAATWAVGHGPGTVAGQALLRAIPASIPPPRRSPLGNELVPDLCAGAVGTAERLRHLAYIVAAHPRCSRAGLAVAWQRTAQGAAITVHCSHLILKRLAQSSAPALPLATSRALAQATSQINEASAAWRAVAHEWDTFTTGPGATITPVAAEISDLVLWVGRLAYTDPAWTPARRQARPLRTSTAMTGDRDTLIHLVGALHQASDALAHIAANDREAVRSAAADGDLYVPRRLLPAEPDLPYRYAPALPAMTDALLASYDATTHAAIRAAAALGNLAVALNPQPTVFAALRATAPLSVPAVPNSPAIPARTPATRSRPGPLERGLRHRDISEPTLLARAADIDDATQDLISAATPPSQRHATANQAILRTLKRSPARSQHPARLAAKDSPTTASNKPLQQLVPINHQIRHGKVARNPQFRDLS